MRFLLAIVAFMFVCFSAWSQEWIEDRSFTANTLALKVDQLGNVYGIRSGEVIKWNDQGKELSRYSNKLIGADIQVDVSNPMKIVLYSPEQMRLIFLDSRLGELQEEINLFREGYEQISLAASSHSNGFWLYDPISFKLIRYDQAFKKEHESFNLAQLLRVQFFPVALREMDNKVYLSDPEQGVFVFDIFGNYIKRIPIKGVQSFVLANQRLFFWKEGQLKALHLGTLEEESVMIEGLNKSGFDISKNRIVAQKEGWVIIFKPKA